MSVDEKWVAQPHSIFETPEPKGWVDGDSPHPPESLTQLLNEHDTLTVSRSAFAATIKELLTQLPDMLASSAENMPVYARAAMPVVRMLLASEDMQNMLSGDSIIDFIWSALESCQNE
jgi:hypothetical protein